MPGGPHNAEEYARPTQPNRSRHAEQSVTTPPNFLASLGRRRDERSQKEKQYRHATERRPFSGDCSLDEGRNNFDPGHVPQRKNVPARRDPPRNKTAEQCARTSFFLIGDRQPKRREGRRHRSRKK